MFSSCLIRPVSFIFSFAQATVKVGRNLHKVNTFGSGDMMLLDQAAYGGAAAAEFNSTALAVQQVR